MSPSCLRRYLRAKEKVMTPPIVWRRQAQQEEALNDQPGKDKKRTLPISPTKKKRMSVGEADTMEKNLETALTNR